MLLRLLVLLLGFQACAGAEDTQEAKEAAADGAGQAEEGHQDERHDTEPAAELWLYCNTTGTCQPCGALRGLNDHCRASGGYVMAQCVVAQPSSWSGAAADFVRAVSDDEGLSAGSTLMQHHGCTPQSAATVADFMLFCGLLGSMALMVVRLRARQLQRLLL